ncbi:YdcF family protein [Haloferula chungangensis]|uniref:YdcF family protein n=1 Tax=Haloferula chungangensis TaxID=1048331 RepID=A0ABW2L9W2_9BACT
MRRLAVVFATLGLALMVALTAWVAWGHWPDPVRGELEWEPDAILVLGGGNIDRPTEARRLATRFPEVPVLVTGDGGMIYDELISQGLPRERLIHETHATSTIENARFTRKILDRLGAERVVLVTDWFHVPRSMEIFQREQPGREFFPVFRPRPEPLNDWHRYGSTRERIAVIHNLIRHGIWPF